jgi:hypothetical protein
MQSRLVRSCVKTSRLPTPEPRPPGGYPGAVPETDVQQFAFVAPEGYTPDDHKRDRALLVAIARGYCLVGPTGLPAGSLMLTSQAEWDAYCARRLEER